MSKFDRIQQLHRILTAARYPVSKRELATQLECTEKSVSRYIDELRDRCLAPLEYLPGSGWQYTPGAAHFELSGLWLTEADIQSLLLLLDMLQGFGNGLLTTELAAIQQIIAKLLAERGMAVDEVQARIRIVPIGHRVTPDHKLTQLFTALMQRRQLNLIYRDYSGRRSEREISPQRLVYYRDNWFVDAWCHLRQGLRTFSLARCQQLEALATPAKDVDTASLNTHFQAGYGLFAGAAKHTAVLRFFPSVAREIALQQWHPQQQGEWDGDDYLLTIPYSNDTELLQDILRHCPHVYVEKPYALRRKLQTRLQDALGVLTGKGIVV